MSTDTRFDGVGPDEVFAAELGAGHFKIQQCQICTAVRFPPALVCSTCGSPKLHWIEASGEGEVYSTTTVHDRAGPFNVSIVTLDEGARMMSRVESPSNTEIGVGTRVTARIARQPQPHIVFDVTVGQKP